MLTGFLRNNLRSNEEEILFPEDPERVKQAVTISYP